MNIRETISNIREKKFEKLKENIEKTLAEKAAIKLEEMKVDLATNYFGTK
jgi:hypothetical protein